MTTFEILQLDWYSLCTIAKEVTPARVTSGADRQGVPPRAVDLNCC